MHNLYECLFIHFLFYQEKQSVATKQKLGFHLHKTVIERYKKMIDLKYKNKYNHSNMYLTWSSL